MLKTARIAITNIYADGDYTGRIQVGPRGLPMNVLLDTGSSQLALNMRSYRPDLAGGDRTTDLAQSGSYADGSSWTGAVIETTVSAGIEGTGVVLEKAHVAVAYRSHRMFGKTDGILGLAYAALDDAYEMQEDTWTRRYRRIGGGRHKFIKPYLTQLGRTGVISDKFAFYTRRSTVRVGHGDIADDIMNQGYMIIGGGEESRDLYRGGFQSVRVLTREYYTTDLKAIVVGDTEPIAVPAKRPGGNSVVDSGTVSLVLPMSLLKKMMSRLSLKLQPLFYWSAIEGRTAAAAAIDLAKWPDIAFVMAGRGGDARLTVKPCDYWQIDAGERGAAESAFEPGAPSDGIILGLPLMNGYFTIFDGEADGGKGEVRFATRKG